MKSLKNKTIDFSLEDGKQYLDKVVSATDYNGENKNCTICGDTLNVLKNMPDKSVDLLIVDPPYNLDKNFHGNGFKKRNLDEYATYTKEAGVFGRKRK